MRFVSIVLLTVPLALAACSGDPDATDVRDVDATDVSGPDGGDGGDSGADAQDSDAAAPDPDASADTDDAGDTSGPLVFTAGDGAALRADPDGGLALTYRGETLFELAPDAIQLGVVRSIDPGASYTPTAFFLSGRYQIAPPLDAWLVPTAWEPAADGLLLRFGESHTAQVTVTADPSASRLSLHVVAAPTSASAAPVAYYRVRLSVSPDERFYGLGEVFDAVEHRGRVRAMQLELDELESSNNEAHVPVPFLVGTSGWGVLFATDRPSVFDVAAADPERVDFVVGTADASADGLVFHLMAAPHPLDVTRHYHELTGRPALPARWALGPWIWRDENESEAQVRTDIRTLRELDLATTAIWIDRPYATAVGAFDWDDRWTDAAALIDDANDHGLRVALWNVPYLEERAASTRALVEEATAQGYYPPVTGALLNGWGRPIDLTNPDAVTWWQGLVRRYTDIGIEGFKLDYGEDIVVGPFGGRVPWRFHNGETDLTAQASFQRFYHRAYAELLPEDGGFLLCRGGTWGDQVNVSVVWPGDLSADLTYHGELVEEDSGDTYRSVGGLPAALIAGMSLGPSGFPLYGSDTGGYRHSPPNRETFIRWFQATALSPVMQVGTSSSDVPWEFNEQNGFDTASLDLYREYARLHLRLWPYVWTLLQQNQVDGRPLQRPLGLAYPATGEHPDDQFLLGDRLLVAPVVREGVRARRVVFPEGEWVDWWTGASVSGPTSLEVDAPLELLPLWIRAGEPVPMLRETIDAIAPVGEGHEMVDSYASAPGRLTLVTTRGETGAFELFDGTTVGQSCTVGRCTFALQAGSEFDEGVRVELFGVTTEPSGVLVDGVAATRDDGAEADLRWRWSSERGGSVVILAPASATAVSVTW